jgi:prephenate dehydrogenase
VVRSIRRVAVVGLGLIGGSLARRVASEYDTVGYDADSDTRHAARAAGLTVGDAVADVVAGRDLVVVATPLESVADVFAEIAVAATDGATVTDVASVKAGPLAAARGSLGTVPTRHRYVGGHPMAGTEESGFAASDPGLFADAAWVLCVEDDTDTDAWLAVADLVTGLGCRVVPCTADGHDAAVARVSGLPHLLAVTLAATVADGGPLPLALAAGSFRDGTRVAATRPELVAALCDGNRAALAEALDAALARLAEARDALRNGRSVSPLAAAGHDARRGWEHLHQSGQRSTLDATVPDLRARLLALGGGGGAVTAVDGDTLHCSMPERES